MSSIVTFLGGDPQFLTNYLFGLVTIILYAKDKFNTPTYDKESMGPFSQLPPQLLTIDARYRQGMRTYIFLLLALYTALCIIGPSTFSQQNIQLGFSADTNQFWPVASATFLISTGAAKDSSILGKIEHFIRQYAQKTAYIPSIVSNLAYSIRNVETIPWLKENKDKLKPDEFEERRATLTALIGEKFVTKINENPRQQGHLAAWARANIVFYCLQQMFRGVLPSEKLSQITEVPENVAIFERLKKEREQLEHRFIAVEEQRDRKSEQLAEGDLDKLLSDVQRFSKEVSLTIVVLLSQAVRTFSDLKERLEQLGFREIELRDNSDHRVYLVMVNFSILLGAFVSYALATGFATFTKWGALKNLPIISGWMPDAAARTELWNDFSVINHAGELLSVMTGVLIYMIVFKVIDYLREGYLDLSDWHENLQGAGICHGGRDGEPLLRGDLYSDHGVAAVAARITLADLDRSGRTGSTVPVSVHCSRPGRRFRGQLSASCGRPELAQRRAQEMVANYSGRIRAFSRKLGLHQGCPRCAGSNSGRRSDLRNRHSCQEQCHRGRQIRSRNRAEQF
jgi:hypothetical protein